VSHWIESAAIEERERLKTVNIWINAGEQFIKLLAERVEADIALYAKEFPENHIDMRPSRLEVTVTRIERSHHSGLPGSGPSISTRASFNPIGKCLHLHIPKSTALSKQITPGIDGENLVLGAGVTVENISQYLLMPVLFPGLLQDAGILDYVQDSFRTR
jgi:hypothetical protein